MRRTLAATILLALVAGVPASARRLTYANPVDIDYRYNWEQTNEGISYRTGADPVIVRHKGAYYLFETLADGYWRSTDLVTWRFITPDKWPTTSVVAPAAWSDGERLYMLPARMEAGVIYVTDAPETGHLDYLTRRSPDLPGAVRPGEEDHLKPGEFPPGPWDPALFEDDDARWYLYWGSSNVFPLYGIELDPKKRLDYIGTPRTFFGLDPAHHGWERFGQDHAGTLPNGTPIKPFIEGAWMTKVRGRYYLQYGAPGTEYNAYSNGTYVGTSPLGPFTYAPYNPVAYKPGGYVQGAGHGSTFADAYGNWWNTGTPWIGYNWTFERRIGMWPARFYPNGQMAVSTRFGDLPHYVPDAPNADPEALFTGWMLISRHARATASSTLGEFAADRTTDENPRTFWVAKDDHPGTTLMLDLGAVKTLCAVQVNFADYKAGRFADAPDIYTEFALEWSADGKAWQPLAKTDAPRRDRPNFYAELPEPVRARFVRYVHGHVGAAHLAIGDLRVFGSADVPVPARPTGVVALRQADRRNAAVTWAAVPGATGYNVRWGIRPDRLTLTYQVWADEHPRSLDVHALNTDQRYWFAVEAFNERGVSSLSKVVAVR